MAVSQATLTLVQAAKKGDNAAFDALLQPLYAPAYRMATAILHDSHAAEDAVQEASIKAWRKLGHLREGSEMRPWFLGIVANECKSARRNRWWSVVRTVFPETVAESKEDSVIEGLDVRRALLAMSESKRLVLHLDYYEDLPIDEIAAVLGTSVHAAESRLTRAKQEFKRRMEAGRGRR